MRADPESLLLPKFLYSWYFYIIILKSLNHCCCPLELSFAQGKNRTYIFGIYIYTILRHYASNWQLTYQKQSRLEGTPGKVQDSF